MLTCAFVHDIHFVMNVSPPLSRRDVIANRLAIGQPVIAGQLAVEFAISEDAIRRDLRALAAEGKCRRVYGGALPLTQPAEPMAARIEHAPRRKRLLAEAAASLILPNEFVFLDSGSTNLAIVDLIQSNLKITLATNSVDIASAVLRRGNIPLILVGGMVNPHVGGSVDAGAIASVGEMNIDRCFLGACSVSAKAGISVYDYSDAIFKKALVRHSSQLVVLSLSEKFQELAPHNICRGSDIDCLIVENQLPAEQEQELSAEGFVILKADGDPTENRSSIEA
jgi:DeoR/GlpR family transcriptional regulator of sugar metabolism